MWWHSIVMSSLLGLRGSHYLDCGTPTVSSYLEHVERYLKVSYLRICEDIQCGFFFSFWCCDYRRESFELLEHGGGDILESIWETDVRVKQTDPDLLASDWFGCYTEDDRYDLQDDLCNIWTVHWVRVLICEGWATMTKIKKDKPTERTSLMSLSRRIIRCNGEWVSSNQTFTKRKN